MKSERGVFAFGIFYIGSHDLLLFFDKRGG